MENDREEARSTTSRARFLGGAAGLTGLAFAGGVFSKEAKAATKASTASVKRAYVSGNFALSLDGGKNIGMLKTAQGGQIYGEPVTEPSESLYAKKHIGNVKYSDITVQMGLSMPTAFYQWIADSWSFGPQRKNGAIIAADFNMNAVKELDFYNALITETTIPAMDGSSKEPAYLTLKLTPESTGPGKPSGKLSIGAQKQKAWLPANFRLDLGKGVDATKVSKIDSFTIKQTMAAPTTDLGDVTIADQVVVVSVPPYQLEPGKIDFPNLRVTLAESSAQTWIDWYESFIRQGNNSDEYEKSGSIKFLANDMTTELARVDLFGVGIFNLTDERPLDAATDAIRRLVAELYVERMEFVFPGMRST
jgi:hypothetical protein